MMTLATVIRVEGLVAVVRVEGADRRATLRGSIKAGPRSSTHPVAVGDHVLIEGDDAGSWVIRGLAERRNLLARADPGDERRYHPIAANIDQVVCVQAFRDPPLNLRALDRLLLLAHAAGVPAWVIINKQDLNTGSGPSELDAYPAIGIPVLRTSARTGAGLCDLEPVLRGKITVLVGPSGAGKSSILNAVVPGLHLRIRPVSRATTRGVHTTARVEWIDLSAGGAVLDTPGLRAIRPWGVDSSNLKEAFPEFAEHRGCRFPDCCHHAEPGCAVRIAVEQGEIPAFRYDSYLRILSTLGGDRPGVQAGGTASECRRGRRGRARRRHRGG